MNNYFTGSSSSGSSMSDGDNNANISSSSSSTGDSSSASSSMNSNVTRPDDVDNEIEMIGIMNLLTERPTGPMRDFIVQQRSLMDYYAHDIRPSNNNNNNNNNSSSSSNADRDNSAVDRSDIRGGAAAANERVDTFPVLDDVPLSLMSEVNDIDMGMSLSSSGSPSSYTSSSYAANGGGRSHRGAVDRQQRQLRFVHEDSDDSWNIGTRFVHPRINGRARHANQSNNYDRDGSSSSSSSASETSSNGSGSGNGRIWTYRDMARRHAENNNNNNIPYDPRSTRWYDQDVTGRPAHGGDVGGLPMRFRGYQTRTGTPNGVNDDDRYDNDLAAHLQGIRGAVRLVSATTPTTVRPVLLRPTGQLPAYTNYNDQHQQPALPERPVLESLPIPEQRQLQFTIVLPNPDRDTESDSDHAGHHHDHHRQWLNRYILNNDVLLTILAFLRPHPHIFPMRAVCRMWREVVDNQLLFHLRQFNILPHAPVPGESNLTIGHAIRYPQTSGHPTLRDDEDINMHSTRLLDRFIRIQHLVPNVEHLTLSVTLDTHVDTLFSSRVNLQRVRRITFVNGYYDNERRQDVPNPRRQAAADNDNNDRNDDDDDAMAYYHYHHLYSNNNSDNNNNNDNSDNNNNINRVNRMRPFRSQMGQWNRSAPRLTNIVERARRVPGLQVDCVGWIARGSSQGTAPFALWPDTFRLRFLFADPGAMRMVSGDFPALTEHLRAHPTVSRSEELQQRHPWMRQQLQQPQGELPENQQELQQPQQQALAVNQRQQHQAFANIAEYLQYMVEELDMDLGSSALLRWYALQIYGGDITEPLPYLMSVRPVATIYALHSRGSVKSSVEQYILEAFEQHARVNVTEVLHFFETFPQTQYDRMLHCFVQRGPMTSLLHGENQETFSTDMREILLLVCRLVRRKGIQVPFQIVLRMLVLALHRDNDPELFHTILSELLQDRDIVHFLNSPVTDSSRSTVLSALCFELWAKHKSNDKPKRASEQIHLLLNSLRTVIAKSMPVNASCADRVRIVFGIEDTQDLFSANHTAQEFITVLALVPCISGLQDPFTGRSVITNHLLMNRDARSREFLIEFGLLPLMQQINWHVRDHNEWMLLDYIFDMARQDERNMNGILYNSFLTKLCQLDSRIIFTRAEGSEKSTFQRILEVQHPLLWMAIQSTVQHLGDVMVTIVRNDGSASSILAPESILFTVFRSDLSDQSFIRSVLQIFKGKIDGATRQLCTSTVIQSEIDKLMPRRR